MCKVSKQFQKYNTQHPSETHLGFDSWAWKFHGEKTSTFSFLIEMKTYYEAYLFMRWSKTLSSATWLGMEGKRESWAVVLSSLPLKCILHEAIILKLLYNIMMTQQLTVSCLFFCPHPRTESRIRKHSTLTALSWLTPGIVKLSCNSLWLCNLTVKYLLGLVRRITLPHTPPVPCHFPTACWDITCFLHFIPENKKA